MKGLYVENTGTKSLPLRGRVSSPVTCSLTVHVLRRAALVLLYCSATTPTQPTQQPSTPPPPSTPTYPRRQYLSRDERLQVQTLALAGHTHKSIATLLKITERQVSYAIASEKVTPEHHSGRPRTLSDAQLDELETFIRSSSR